MKMISPALFTEILNQFMTSMKIKIEILPQENASTFSAVAHALGVPQPNR